MFAFDGNFALWAWNGLPLNTYISVYARTNKCYNERGSRTNYVRSSITHCICIYTLFILEELYTTFSHRL